MNDKEKHGVLFVCLGNICRSPMAEAIARRKFDSAGLALPVASAGTGNWHVGQGADPRACRIAGANGYPLDAHRARQVARRDFDQFDWLLAMDRDNLAALHELAPTASRARCALLLDAAGITAGGEVPDPYFGGEDGFAEVLGLLERAIDGFAGVLRTSGAGSRVR